MSCIIGYIMSRIIILYRVNVIVFKRYYIRISSFASTSYKNGISWTSFLS